MSPSSRIWDLRFATGLVFALPIAIVTVWYAWSAYAAIDRYRRAAGPKQKITAELFQLALHDELTRDFRRLTLADRPDHSRLPVFAISLTRESLDQLGGRGPAKEGEANYVEALVMKDGEVHEGKVRYRGGQPWHFLGVQKSMKVRLDRGDLIDGTRVFNLINDPTPFGLEDQIILDLARESGLLTPEYRPAWVRLNNSDLGVYRYEAQPDEGLLRRARRMPGSMYSGDSDDGNVFKNPQAWQKVAERSEESKEDRRELDVFLQAVNEAAHQEFADYVERALDLEKYAKFDALDVVFGVNEHDYLSNHKFYVDPYTGKFEPVSWSFRGFQHEPRVNLIDHPLLVRLKFIPGYSAKRDRAVYELLSGKASVPAIRTRVTEAFRALIPELAADPYWDAYKLLPNAGRFLRYMPRPMSVERWAFAAEAELAGYAERTRWLANLLEQPNISARADKNMVEVTVGGHGAYRLRDVTVRGDCAGPITWWADVDRDGAFDRSRDLAAGTGVFGEPLAIEARAELYAGAKLVRRPDAQAKRGEVSVEPEERRYRWFIDGRGCLVEEVRLLLDNLVIGGTVRLAATPGVLETVATATVSASSKLRLAAGERSPHPWDFPAPPRAEEIVLGPGEVRIDETRRFEAHQTVRIARGTNLSLGPGVSLIFEGPVFAAKSKIKRADPARAFGGLALQGPGTRGSRLSGLDVSGGSRVAAGAIAYSALINVHDTSDVAFEDLRITGTTDAEDVFHANGVTNLQLHEAQLEGAPIDGIDLELTSAELRGVHLGAAGDDCLDIGVSSVQLRDSVLAGCKNNGISAGEESEVDLHGVVIADSKVGVLAKNGSDVRATRSLIYRAEIALETHAKEIYYTNKSSIGAAELFAVGCAAVYDAAKGTTIEAGAVQTTLPQPAMLEHLRTQVLGLGSWSELDARLQALRAGGKG